jgi:hypothetical protein
MPQKFPVCDFQIPPTSSPMAFSARFRPIHQPFPIRRSWALVGTVVVLLLVNGCKEADEIRSYSVAKPPPPPKSHRMLAAVVPDELSAEEKAAKAAQKAGDEDSGKAKEPPMSQAWFFKVLGPVEQVNAAAAAFDQFIASVRIGDEDLPKWELPEGWTAAPAQGSEFGRAATIRIGDGRPPLELAVSKLPMPENRRESWLLGNINRWRDQLQLAPIGRSELQEYTDEIKAGEETAFKVDLLGAFSGSARAPMLAGNSPHANLPAAALQSNPPPADRPADRGNGRAARDSIPFEAEVPGDWKPGRMNEFRVASYNVGGDETGSPAELTVTPLGPAAGDLKANVDRWRGEIKLRPTSGGELEELVKSIEVDGTAADYVELVGPEQASPREATLGVILRRSDRVWFFKLRGPAETVERHKEQFEAYVKSVKFK